MTYKEQLSENQWLKIIEAGGDPQQEIEKRRKQGDNPAGQLDGAGQEDGAELSDRLVSEEEDYDEEEMSNDDFVVGGGKSRRKNK